MHGGVLAHAEAVAADVDQMAVMQHPVDERGRHDFVAQDGAPVLEALVGGQDRRGVLVGPVHELEEQDRAGVTDRQIADLVDHERRWVGEHRQASRQLAGGLRLFERADQVGERAEVDPPPTLGRGDRQADGQMRLAGPRRSEEDDVLLTLDEAELAQALDLLALDRGLEKEVEPLESGTRTLRNPVRGTAASLKVAVDGYMVRSDAVGLRSSFALFVLSLS